MYSSLDDALVTPPTSSSGLFHNQPMIKTLDLAELPKVTNTAKALYTKHVVKALNTE